MLTKPYDAVENKNDPTKVMASAANPKMMKTTNNGVNSLMVDQSLS